MASKARTRVDRLTGHLTAVNNNTACQHAHASVSGCSSSSQQRQYTTVRREGRVLVLTLNRPKALNALCDGLMAEVSSAVAEADADESLGCVVLTGAGRAFAAGADITEMQGKDYHAMSKIDKFDSWENLAKSKIPVIAAVNGYALGGGCELAMMCDILIASEKAIFGQPEIKIGTIPAAGGTQRLTKALGKSRAMELILTGGNLSAKDAERLGLASHVVPHDQLMPVSMKLAAKIANLSRPVVRLAKAAVNASYETTLTQGSVFERRLFQSSFALQDQTEGMDAFAEKRMPQWKHC